MAMASSSSQSYYDPHNVGVAAFWHSLEETSANDIASIDHAALFENGFCTSDDARQIKQGAADVRMSTEDRRKHQPVSTADVNDVAKR